jgi:hypothetical protein
MAPVERNGFRGGMPRAWQRRSPWDQISDEDELKFDPNRSAANKRLTATLPEKEREALHQTGSGRHAEQYSAVHLPPGRKLCEAGRCGVGWTSLPSYAVALYGGVST